MVADSHNVGCETKYAKESKELNYVFVFFFLNERRFEDRYDLEERVDFEKEEELQTIH